MPLTKLRKTPGVYVEEIATFPPSVVPVETAIPAFIGYTPLHPEGEMKAIRITSMLEFDQHFLEDKNPGNPRVKKVPTQKKNRSDH